MKIIIGIAIVQIDKKNLEKVKKYHWNMNVMQDGRVYFNARVNGRPTHLHRYLLDVTDSNVMVDHRNGNTYNNKESNLRKATAQQNLANSKGEPNTSSKYKGVKRHSAGHFWQAQIGHNYKQFYLGIFKSEEEAALAYDKKARELYGEFARTNFS